MPTSYTYNKETLQPFLPSILDLLRARLDPATASRLTGRRTVHRHGTCGDVCFWSFWDSRQASIGVDSGYFCYAISYDPVQFELNQHDWAVVLHLNTVRSYRGNFDIRGFLKTNLPPTLPKGFELQEHPRQFRITREFDFTGPPSDLPRVAIEPMLTLFRATYPVLDQLYQEIERADRDRKQPAPSPGLVADKSRASNPHRPGPKNILNRAIPRTIRLRVLEEHGWVCHLCQKVIESEDDLHIDHVLPWAQGGTTHLENLRPAHRLCNLQKGAGNKTLPPEQRSPAKPRPGWRKIR